MADFPRPTRPDNSYNSPSSSNTRIPGELVISSEIPHGFIPESETSYTDEDSPVLAYPPPANMSVNSTDESMEELRRGIMELYEKLPASIRKRVNLERCFIPTDLVAGLKVDAASSRQVQGIVDQLSPKLERFKVRTVQAAGGVVKAEDDDKSSVK